METSATLLTMTRAATMRSRKVIQVHRLHANRNELQLLLQLPKRQTTPIPIQICPKNGNIELDLTILSELNHFRSYSLLFLSDCLSKPMI